MTDSAGSRKFEEYERHRRGEPFHPRRIARGSRRVMPSSGLAGSSLRGKFYSLSLFVPIANLISTQTLVPPPAP